MGDEGGDSEPSCESVDSVPIKIRCTNGTIFTVRTSLELTVVDFKGLVGEKCDVPADQQRLIYKGRILKDDQTLKTFGLQADNTVHMVQFVSPSLNSPPPPVISAGLGNTTTRSNRGTGSNEAGLLGGIGSPLFSDLGLNTLGCGSVGGAFNLSRTGFRDFELVQQRPNQNPNMMTELMNIRAIQNVLNDPDSIRTSLLSDPRMRYFIDRDPELARVLNDSEIHRRILESARNRKPMRVTMRGAVRAKRSSECYPKGFHRLRCIYENILKPLGDAARLGGNNNSNLNSNPSVALLGNQGGTQPRNASNNPTTTASETPAVPNTNPLPNPWNAAGIQPNVGERGTIPTRRGLGGLCGLGGPGAIESLLNDMVDTIPTSQIIQNPAMVSFMQSLLSNPAYLNQIRNFNPQLRAIFDTNPRLRAMLGNTEVLRDMISAGTRHQMRNGQQNISLLNRRQSTQNSAAPGAATEERYATQLSQLQQMGFSNTEENIRALRASWGNVREAIERLMRNRGR